jgi:hypothetical protein
MSGKSERASEMPETSRDQESQKPRVRTFSWADPAIGVEAARSLSGVDFVRKIMRGQIRRRIHTGLRGDELVWGRRAQEHAR